MSHDADRRAQLLALRAASGLSQAAMARCLETPLNTYKQWESGARRTPGVAVVAATLLARRQGAIKTRPERDWLATLREANEQQRSISDIAREVGCSVDAVRGAVGAYWPGPWPHDGRRTARKTKWREILQQADQRGLTLAEIAREEGVSWLAVRDASARYWPGPWPHRPQKAHDWPELLQEMDKRGLAPSEIARELQLSSSSVYGAILRHWPGPWRHKMSPEQRGRDLRGQR